MANAHSMRAYVGNDKTPAQRAAILEEALLRIVQTVERTPANRRVERLAILALVDSRDIIFGPETTTDQMARIVLAEFGLLPE